MDFQLSEKAEILRKDVRSFLADVVTAEMLDHCYETGVNHDDGFSKAMRDKGLLAPGWPKEFGGQGLDPYEVLAVSEELMLAGAPTYALGTTLMVASVIREVGTEHLKEKIIPRALSADVLIALGFTEPENGSDAAAAATRATRDGDGWRINGSKMFTTNAHVADYVFMLARTNLDAAKHRGLTTFLVPLDQPGVEIQPVYTLSGERTNITFYNDVYVADEWRIGDVDAGWQVMGVALGLEHASGFGAEIDRMIVGVSEWALETPARREDPAVRERIGRAVANAEVSKLLMRRCAWMSANGQAPHSKGSMSKLFSSERLERMAADLIDMVGPDSVRKRGDKTALAKGHIEHALRNAKGTTIYAGSSEIQRNIIAQRGLGLPRSA